MQELNNQIINCKLIIKTSDFVKTDLWKLFPVINVDYVSDIPSDYLGAMGVPITFMDKFNPEQFEIIDHLKPVINGKQKYERIIIRHLKPSVGEEVELEAQVIGNIHGNPELLEVEE